MTSFIGACLVHAKVIRFDLMRECLLLVFIGRGINPHGNVESRLRQTAQPVKWPIQVGRHRGDD